MNELVDFLRGNDYAILVDRIALLIIGAHMLMFAWRCRTRDYQFLAILEWMTLHEKKVSEAIQQTHQKLEDISKYIKDHK